MSEMSYMKYSLKDTKYFGVSFPKEIVEKVDRIRGDIPRSKFLLRLVENKIQESQI